MLKKLAKIFFILTVSFFIVSCSQEKKKVVIVSRNGEVVDVGDVGLYTSLSLDVNELPHISYYDRPNNDLKYASFNGVSWEIEVVDSKNAVGEYSSLDIDSEGKPYISYLDMSQGGALKLASKDEEGNWIFDIIDDSESSGKFSSMIIDSENHIHISYLDILNWNLKYAYYDGEKWEYVTVDAGDQVGEFTSIGVDSGNKPHVSYHDDFNGALKYAYCDLPDCLDVNSWTILTVDNPPIDEFSKKAHVGHYTSIDMDNDDLPHISYYDLTNNVLNYTHFDGKKWHITKIDGGNIATNSKGEYTSLQLGLDKKPKIVYYDRLVGSLKLAFLLDSGKWNKTTLDGGDISGIREFAGLYNSLKIDSAGSLHVSYFDNTNKTLMYLKY